MIPETGRAAAGEPTLATMHPADIFLEYTPKIRRALLLGLIALLPLLVTYGVGLRDPFNTAKVGLLIFGVTLVGALRGAELIVGASSSGITRLIVPAMSFSIPFFFAWLASPDRAFALSGWDYGRYQGLMPYLLAVALGMLIADAFAGRAHQIAWALGAAGTAVAVYGLIQFFGWDVFPSGPGWSGSGRSITTLGNSNFTGGFLAITLAVTVPLAVGGGGSSKLAQVMVYLMAIGLGRSYSQGAWIAGIGGVAVALGIVMAPRWSKARVAGTLVAILMVVGSVGAVLMALAGVDLPVLSTVRSRGLTWETTIRAAGDDLLLGHGLNSFGQVQAQYRSEASRADQDLRNLVPDDPHSVPLAMLVNAGLLTFLGFAGVVWWFALKATKVPAGDRIGAAFVGAVAAYLIQALSSIDEVTLRVAFWVCLGGLAVFHALPDPIADRAAGNGSRILRVALGTALVAAGIVVATSLAFRFVDLHRV